MKSGRERAQFAASLISPGLLFVLPLQLSLLLRFHAQDLIVPVLVLAQSVDEVLASVAQRNP